MLSSEEVGIQFALLYKPNSWQQPNAALNFYSPQFCFPPFNCHQDTKESFMCHSVPSSLCALFTPLQHSICYSNTMKQTASTDACSQKMSFCVKMFLHPSHLKTCLYPHPPKSMLENIAKAATNLTQICKKFAVMKPSMWMTFHQSNTR